MDSFHSTILSFLWYLEVLEAQKYIGLIQVNQKELHITSKLSMFVSGFGSHMLRFTLCPVISQDYDGNYNSISIARNE